MYSDAPLTFDLSDIGIPDSVVIPQDVSNRFNCMCTVGLQNLVTAMPGLYSTNVPTSTEFSHYLVNGITNISEELNQVRKGQAVTQTKHPKGVCCIGLRSVNQGTRHYMVHIGHGVYLSKLGVGVLVISDLKQMFSLYMLEMAYMCKYGPTNKHSKQNFDPSGGGAGSIAF